MAFGDSIFPDNLGTPVGQAQSYPSYTAILKTGSKASWQNVIAAGTVTADCHWIRVEIADTQATGVDTSAILDVGVDPAGGTSYSVVIADLLAGYCDTLTGSTAPGGQTAYGIPLKITSGSSVAIRGQTIRVADANAKIRVSMMGGATGTPYSGTTCTTYGISGQTGTSVTPGSNAYGSWTSIGSTTAVDLQAIMVGMQPLPGTAVSSNVYTVQVGVSSTVISPQFDFLVSSQEGRNGPRPESAFYNFVASGSQLQVRAKASNGNTIETIKVALYGTSAT